MNSKVLEVLNQLIILVIYGIILTREISNQSLDAINTIISIGGIIFSVTLMLFIWYLKSQNKIY